MAKTVPQVVMDFFHIFEKKFTLMSLIPGGTTPPPPGCVTKVCRLSNRTEKHARMFFFSKYEMTVIERINFKIVDLLIHS